MTFGEHLEELRVCLFRAIIGLTFGFLIGLWFGGDLVEFIQTPLKKALSKYVEDRNQKRLEDMQDKGLLPPGEVQGYEQLVTKDHLAAERVLVDPHGLWEAMREKYPNLPPPGRLARSGEKQTPGNANAPPGEDTEREPMSVDDLLPMFIWRPVADEVRVTSLSAHEPFTIYVKASLVLGALISSPWIFYQIWIFVAAGLYPHEKSYVHIFLPLSLGLFLLGVAVAFFFVFEPVLRFLFMFNSWLDIEQDIRISEWLGFVLMLPLGFGVAFQLPLVMLFLERIGIMDVEGYVAKWRIAVLVIFIIGMLLTPADPYSMLLMAVPLTVLYFGGILLCKYMPRRKSPFDEEQTEDRG